MVAEERLSQTNAMGRVGGWVGWVGWVGGWVTIQKIMPLHGLSCKLRLSRSSAELRFQDRPSVAIIFAPTTIILHLLRFSYDEQQEKTIKSSCPIFCPPMLTLPTGPTYVLNSVINHIGESATSGHYNIVIFDEPLNQFILLDDSEITYNVTFDDDMVQQSYVVTYTRI